MAKTREDLHALLEVILGSSHVYFQPPESLRMSYPAIVYSRKAHSNRFADNAVYTRDHEYEVIVIDSDPDSRAAEKLSLLPLCRFDRHYHADHLNHDVFTIFY